MKQRELVLTLPRVTSTGFSAVGGTSTQLIISHVEVVELVREGQQYQRSCGKLYLFYYNTPSVKYISCIVYSMLLLLHTLVVHLRRYLCYGTVNMVSQVETKLLAPSPGG